MKKYKFNWDELKELSNNNFDGIVVLAYCITFDIGSLVSKSTINLTNFLRIATIPGILFKNGCLIRNLQGNIINNYKTKDPITYFRNFKFLYYNTTPLIKCAYLYMLAQRRMSELNNSIPLSYITNTALLSNPYITIENDKIIFSLEKEQQEKNKQ